MKHEVILDEANREAMRKVIAERGKAMDSSRREAYPDNPDRWINYYGWDDYKTQNHLREASCSYVVPKGVVITEIDFSQFEGTDHDSSEYHGIMAYGEGDSEITCACGKLSNLTLLYMGTFSDLLLATLSKLNGGRPEDPRLGIQL